MCFGERLLFGLQCLQLALQRFNLAITIFELTLKLLKRTYFLTQFFKLGISLFNIYRVLILFFVKACLQLSQLLLVALGSSFEFRLKR